MSLDTTIHGLALTAALEIVNHPEVAISLCGSTARTYNNDPVGLLQELIHSTILAGLNFQADNPLTAGPTQSSLEEPAGNTQGA